MPRYWLVKIFQSCWVLGDGLSNNLDPSVNCESHLGKFHIMHFFLLLNLFIFCVCACMLDWVNDTVLVV